MFLYYYHHPHHLPLQPEASLAAFVVAFVILVRLTLLLYVLLSVHSTKL